MRERGSDGRSSMNPSQNDALMPPNPALVRIFSQMSHISNAQDFMARSPESSRKNTEDDVQLAREVSMFHRMNNNKYEASNRMIHSRTEPLEKKRSDTRLPN